MEYENGILALERIMKIDEFKSDFRVEFTEQERDNGLPAYLHKRLPAFGVKRSEDSLNWTFSIRYREKFEKLVHQFYSQQELDLF